MPTFHQFKKEIEDGYRQDNEIVRIGYKDEDFPGYSWRGYGVYSQLQDEVGIKINSIENIGNLVIMNLLLDLDILKVIYRLISL